MSDVASGALDRTEDGRGRSARTPGKIPLLGWRDIGHRVIRKVLADRVGTVAGGTTFFLILALFPALAALVSLYGLVADPVSIADRLADLKGYVPADLLDLIAGELTRLLEKHTATLSFGFISGLVVALWSASSGMRAMFDALNVAYEEEEKRSFSRRVLISLIFTGGAIVFFVILINLMVGVPIAVNVLDLGPIGEILLAVLPTVLMFAFTIFALAILYRFGPSRRDAKWRWVTPGALFAASVWLIGSVTFSWYLANWSNYSATYGSLGTVIGVMMWMYLSLWVVLVGAELNAQMEHQTTQDSTIGADKPLGDRGATMADTIGESHAE